MSDASACGDSWAGPSPGGTPVVRNGGVINLFPTLSLSFLSTPAGYPRSLTPPGSNGVGHSSRHVCAFPKGPTCLLLMLEISHQKQSGSPRCLSSGHFRVFPEVLPLPLAGPLRQPQANICFVGKWILAHRQRPIGHRPVRGVSCALITLHKAFLKFRTSFRGGWSSENCVTVFYSLAGKSYSAGPHVHFGR